MKYVLLIVLLCGFAGCTITNRPIRNSIWSESAALDKELERLERDVAFHQNRCHELSLNKEGGEYAEARKKLTHATASFNAVQVLRDEATARSNPK